jgi:hypothetical protein
VIKTARSCDMGRSLAVEEQRCHESVSVTENEAGIRGGLGDSAGMRRDDGKDSVRSWCLRRFPVEKGRGDDDITFDGSVDE